ncbi:MAG: alpha/beta fold hydrolase, partial [Candidatus Sungiibacteriota bacterium]
MNAERKLAQLVQTDIKIEQAIIGRFRINYVSAGSGPAVILLHGANIGWGQWYPNIAVLAQYFTVYAIDLPGAGGSSKIEFHTANLEKDFVDTVDSFIKDRRLSKVHIVGHSLSGWIALR